MDLAELNRKLIAAARANPPSQRVPFAFEKRIMARLTRPFEPDYRALWARALWRAAAPCVGIMLLFSAWAFFARDRRSGGGTVRAPAHSALTARSRCGSLGAIQLGRGDAARVPAAHRTGPES